MARRRNLKDLLTPDPTPDKQLTHPSGWCMTLTHESCPSQFSHGKCGCACHTKPAPAKRGRPKSVKEAPKVSEVETKQDDLTLDPRPWKR